MRTLINSLSAGALAVLAATAAAADDLDRNQSDRQESVKVSQFRLTTEKRHTYPDSEHESRAGDDRYESRRVHHKDRTRQRYRTHRSHDHYRDRHYRDRDYRDRHYRDRHYRHRHYRDDHYRYDSYYRDRYRNERRHRRAVRRAWHRSHSHYHYGDYCPFARTSYPYYDYYLDTWIIVPLHRH